MRNVLLSGGVGHDFPATSTCLAETLASVGFHTTVHEDLDEAVRHLPEADLVTVNMLRWTMSQPKYAEQRGRWGLHTSPELRQGLTGHVERGGGLLGVHTASICFDDWPAWRSVLGARWVWGRSSHPPVGPVTVQVHTSRHPVVANVADFRTDDEIYGSLEYEPDVVPLVTGRHDGADHPLVWVRPVKAGRVAYNALGHHPPSYVAPENRVILQRLALWAVGAADSEHTSTSQASEGRR